MCITEQCLKRAEVGSKTSTRGKVEELGNCLNATFGVHTVNIG